MQRRNTSVAVGLAILSAWSAVAWGATFQRQPYAQNVTASSVVLKWRQTVGAATVSYGPKGGSMAMQSVPSGTDQEVSLSGLTAGTRYAYSIDAGGGNVSAGEFTTAVKASDPFTFIVYGDNRTDDAAHQTVVDAMVKEGVDFLVNTGDVLDVPSSSAYDNFFAIEAPLLSQNVLFTTFGNHEYAIGTGTTLWQQQFANPTASSGTERYYSFDFGNSRFVVLDFNSMTSAQTTWLGTTLADARTANVTHIFAFMHHSPYDSGNHGENTTAQTAWAPLFSQYGVDLIVGGHDHDYERGFNATTNLRYVITGGGGAPLYTTNSKRSYQQVFNATHHYIKISVNGAMVTVVAQKPDGTVIDSFNWSSGAGPADMGLGGPIDMSTTMTGNDDGGVTEPDLTTTGQPPVPEPAAGCSCAVGAGGGRAADQPLGSLALAALALAALLGRWHGSRRRR